MIKIDQTVPADLGIHVVRDNYDVSKHPAVNAWLSDHPRPKLGVGLRPCTLAFVHGSFGAPHLRLWPSIAAGSAGLALKVGV